MKYLIICTFLTTLLTLQGCANKDTQPEPENSTQVTFFDSSIFDEDLQTGLKGAPQEVVINVPGRFSLNSIPERVERWLAATKERGGQVSVAPSDNSVATRGFLLDAIELVIRTYDNLTEEDLYDSVEGYDGKLVYGEDGKVEKIVFVKRG